MNKLFILVALILSIAINPAAHAAGYGCGDRSGAQSLHQVQDAAADKKDEGKAASADHHCACGHASTQSIERTTLPLESLAASRNSLFDDGRPASVVVGPPLQPPSIA